jgi:hypothetical protein
VTDVLPPAIGKAGWAMHLAGTVTRQARPPLVSILSIYCGRGLSFWILEYSTGREMKGKRRDCKADAGAPLALIVIPRCYCMVLMRKSASALFESNRAKYYVIIPATWSHD